MAGSVPVRTFAAISPMAKKTVDKTAIPMAAKVASLAGAAALPVAIVATRSAMDGQSARAEAEGGGLMWAGTISARAWGFTRSGEPAQ
jgi:hypothetical protein